MFGRVRKPAICLSSCIFCDCKSHLFSMFGFLCDLYIFVTLFPRLKFTNTFLTDVTYTLVRFTVQKYSTILLLLIINKNVLESTGVTLVSYLSYVSHYIKKIKKNKQKQHFFLPSSNTVTSGVRSLFLVCCTNSSPSSRT